MQVYDVDPQKAWGKIPEVAGVVGRIMTSQRCPHRNPWNL